VKWYIRLFILLTIIRVTSAGTVVFDSGAQLMVDPAGPLPHVGEATVTWHDCNPWTLWLVCKATITQDGSAPIEAVQ
jgi:hypothetical protein